MICCILVFFLMWVDKYITWHAYERDEYFIGNPDVQVNGPMDSAIVGFPNLKRTFLYAFYRQLPF